MRIQPPIERVEVPAALRCMVLCLATDSPKTAAGSRLLWWRVSRHRGFRYGHCPARLRRAVVLPAASVYLPYTGLAGFRAKQRLLRKSLRRRPSDTPSCNLP